MQLELPVKRPGRGSELNTWRPERAGDRGRAVLSSTAPPLAGSFHLGPVATRPRLRHLHACPQELEAGACGLRDLPAQALVFSRAGFLRPCQVPREMRVSPCGSLARPLLGPCGFHSLGTRIYLDRIPVPHEQCEFSIHIRPRPEVLVLYVVGDFSPTHSLGAM